MGRKIEDLTGRRFGRLVVVECAPRTQGRAAWICKCDCGNEAVEILDHRLKSGNTKSCGCLSLLIEDLTNRRFGRLTVEKPGNRDKWRGRYWYCKCDCGNLIKIQRSSLIQGKTTSCGCYCKEQTSKAVTTHGLSTSRIYRTYTDILTRCYGPNNKAYKYYGGRGILVCKEWYEDFMIFYQWAIANGYKDNLTIERIDVNGNYEPSNCKWIPRSEQTKNTRLTKPISYNGKSQILPMWADELGINKRTLYARLFTYHWSKERAFTTSVRKHI